MHTCTHAHTHTCMQATPAGPGSEAGTARGGRGRSDSEFRDVVFEDVVFDDNSSVAPHQVTSNYRIRLNILLSNTTSSNTTSLNSESEPLALLNATCRALDTMRHIRHRLNLNGYFDRRVPSLLFARSCRNDVSMRGKAFWLSLEGKVPTQLSTN